MINDSGALAERLAYAGHLPPQEAGSAADLIAAAYTHDAGLPLADEVMQTVALTHTARAIVEHAQDYGTVLRPTAPRLQGLAVAVWLPAEAPPLPDVDADLVAAGGTYIRQLFAYHAMLRTHQSDERYDVLWFTAVHPAIRRCQIASSLLQHRHLVLASQNRPVFSLAPTAPARALLFAVGFRDHARAVAPGSSGIPPFPMLWGRRPSWTGLINKGSAGKRVAGAGR